MQSFISCYFCRRLLSRFLSRLRPVNTSHSLLVSSTNLSFSYSFLLFLALSSFFSPRASPSPPFPLLFVQSTYSSLANRQRKRSSNTFIPAKGETFKYHRFYFKLRYRLFLFFFLLFLIASIFSSTTVSFFFPPTNSSARVDQSRRKKEKKKKGNNVRSIILSSRFDHSMIIPYLFLKKIFLSSLCFNGHRRSTGRTMDVRTIFRKCAIYLACPILIEDERNT